MKIHITKLTFRGFAAALALAAPGLGWAADHLLSLTGITQQTTCNVTQVQAGVVSGGVVSATPLRLSGLRAQPNNDNNCNGPLAVINNVDFTGTLVPVTEDTKRCKPGTNGTNEWLDQGPTILGANGTLTGSGSVTSGQTTVTNTYQVVLTTVAQTNLATPLPCTLDSNNYTVTRTVQISRTTNGALNLATASFIFPDTNTIPEPGTLSLIGLGLAGLGWVGARRARKARASTI